MAVAGAPPSSLVLQHIGSPIKSYCDWVALWMPIPKKSPHGSSRNDGEIHLAGHETVGLPQLVQVPHQQTEK